ncbi:hypothetical protein Y032_0793g2383 [Ancylostoma ceylanicum]|nr:hypothetical protein Y032_0238g3297 [Ancylostoma ceylanicum]EYC37412.1 hypothetical protein Y032_0793g2383 [Ancylostoma ceylanicum]
MKIFERNLKLDTAPDALQAVRLLAEKHREDGKLQLALLDLDKAFDVATRELIRLSLRARVLEEYAF